ncbi:MAG: hypothetical protein JXR96_00885 [Deltaproteobacteria bacterium]|nr:hypothetical protein [Deltaproteobacteria bacterium]
MKIRMTIPAWLGLLIYTLLPACEGHGGTKTTVSHASAKEGKARVVVRPFTAEGIEKDDAGGIEESFCTNLQQRGVNSLCSSDIKAMFQHKQQQILLGDCDSEDCMSQIGRITEADTVIQVTLSRVGRRYVFGVGIYDGKSGALKTRLAHEVDVERIEGLLDHLPGLAEQVQAQL